jgi:hypothetical protein
MAVFNSKRASISVRRGDEELTIKMSDRHVEVREIESFLALLHRLVAWFTSFS